MKWVTSVNHKFLYRKYKGCVYMTASHRLYSSAKITATTQQQLAPASASATDNHSTHSPRAISHCQCYAASYTQQQWTWIESSLHRRIVQPKREKYMLCQQVVITLTRGESP